MLRIRVKSTSEQQSAIQQATAILSAGGLIIFPTETTYGVGVDATNPAAVQKLLKYKSRREGKPLSIAVSSVAMAAEYVAVNDQAAAAYQQFLPGPVTVVSQSRGRVAPEVASEFNTLGIRIPDYPLILQLINAYGKPITATSANMSGGKRPYDIDSLLSQLPKKQLGLIDCVLDAGKLPPNPPSLVIDTSFSAPVTLRARDERASDERSLDSDEEGLDSAAPTTLVSDSPEMTERIAGTYLLKYWNDITSRGLVIGLDGELGTGKTVFAKGAADFLKIQDKMSSPTYTYIESYDFPRHGVRGQLHHCDFWKIASQDELRLLGVDTLLGAKQVVLIEWWQQVAQWLLPQLTIKNIPLVQILIQDPNKGTERRIQIDESHAK
ncbi:MAG: L-threonylcarbamoyladenylate synthase [Patescibacteria group bacterium]